MKKKSQQTIFEATTKSGVTQRFNAYICNKTGKYMTRFYVDNYNHSQFSGSGCTHKKREDAIALGYKIASCLQTGGDVKEIKELLNLNSKYNKVFA